MTFDPRSPISSSEFRSQMVARIRERYGDMLGVHAALLDDEEGLEELAFRIRCGEFGPLP